jgi:hypothetical protein
MSCVETTVSQTPPEYGVITVGNPLYFNNVRTFSWHPVAVKVFLDGESKQQLAIPLFKELIEQQMLAKGYQLVANTENSVMMSFGLAKESLLSDESIYRGTKLSTGVEKFYFDNKPSEKGSIYITFYSGNLNSPDWKVLAQGAIASGLSDEESAQRATDVISLMLSKVPERRALH